MEKQKKSKLVSIRIFEDSRKKIRTEAAKLGVTMGKVVANLLTK